MPRLLLITPKASYLIARYLSAGRRLGVEVIVASDGKDALSQHDLPGLTLDLRDMVGSLETINLVHRVVAFDGVLGTDDSVVELAALAARSLSLPGNPAESVKVGTRKDLSRKAQARSGLRTPWFQCLNLDRSTFIEIPEGIPYPCIAKPVSLSASRGVIRVNNRKELLLALPRIKNIIEVSGPQHPRICLLEKYIPGREYVFEGLLEGGKLVTLAIFSKPTYMAGPFFEETIYVSCPKLSNQIKRPLVGIVQAACRSYGWVHGPVHAECRANRRGLWIIEIAPRTIGGSCGKILETGASRPLEETVIQNALGMRQSIGNTQVAVGVMMIPVPGSGVLRRVEGVENARQVKHIDKIEIDIQRGQRMIPWPEGSPYPGFIFAKAPSGAGVTRALRQAHSRLNFVLAPEISVVTRV